MPLPRFTFVVRIWFELEPDLEGYVAGLRGSVQRIGTDNVQYFHTLENLMAVIGSAAEAGASTAEPPVIKSGFDGRSGEKDSP